LSKGQLLAEIKNVDGAGSGLDADTVDGVQGTQFIRSDVDATATGHIITKHNTPAINTASYTQGSIEVKTDDGSHPIIGFHTAGVSATVLTERGGQLLTSNNASATLNKLWHQGNDGAGSGLDADLLRGLPADFTSSKATNGYQKLPGGLIIQWGSSTVSNVVFPVSFPTAVLNASATKGVVGGSSGANTAEMVLGSVTLSGCTVSAYQAGGGFRTYQGVLWMAIGY